MIYAGNKSINTNSSVARLSCVVDTFTAVVNNGREIGKVTNKHSLEEFIKISQTSWKSGNRVGKID